MMTDPRPSTIPATPPPPSTGDQPASPVDRPQPADDQIEPAAVDQAAPAAVIEADESGDDDGGYATDNSSNAATSLSSSVRDYNFEFRRRYHKFKEGRYLFPNDDAEQEREDMKHAMVVQLCEGNLHNAPLENPQKVLDVGTGTGIWAIEMGEDYPEATVTGIDLSPIQPQYVPPNVDFIVDDAEAEWLYPDDSFDYIHLRHMASSIKDWQRLLEQAYRVLKPGGWIELQDMKWTFDCDDGSMPETSTPPEFTRLVREALAKFGVDLFAADKHAQRLRDAGFVNQVNETKKVPVGPWPLREDLRFVGSYAQATVYDGLHGITVGPLTKGLGWTPMEVELFLVKLRKDLRNPAYHSYAFYYSFSGQKPRVETQ